MQGYQMQGASPAQGGGMAMQNLAMNPALAAQVAAQQGQAGLQMQKANSGQLHQMAGMQGGEQMGVCGCVCVGLIMQKRLV
jgi:hypothetical protein